jgi:hypothetical protein
MRPHSICGAGSGELSAAPEPYASKCKLSTTASNLHGEEIPHSAMHWCVFALHRMATRSLISITRHLFKHPIETLVCMLYCVIASDHPDTKTRIIYVLIGALHLAQKPPKPAPSSVTTTTKPKL